MTGKNPASPEVALGDRPTKQNNRKLDYQCGRQHDIEAQPSVAGGSMETKFLTPEEVSERYRGSVSVGTLRNWRAMKVGPSFVKIGKAVLYPIDELEAWDQRNRVRCRASKRRDESVGDQA